MARRIDYTELKRLRDSGMRAGDIAGRLGCSESAVHNAARVFGWQKRTPGPARPIDVPRLFLMWHSEMATPDIAMAFGVSVSTLNTLRKRHGLPKRPRVASAKIVDPTPDEITARARECRERHYAERRGQGGAA